MILDLNNTDFIFLRDPTESRVNTAVRACSAGILSWVTGTIRASEGFRKGKPCVHLTGSMCVSGAMRRRVSITVVGF